VVKHAVTCVRKSDVETVFIDSESREESHERNDRLAAAHVGHVDCLALGARQHVAGLDDAPQRFLPE